MQTITSWEEKGIERGIEKGMLKERQTIALNLWRENISLGTID